MPIRTISIFNATTPFEEEIKLPFVGKSLKVVMVRTYISGAVVGTIAIQSDLQDYTRWLAHGVDTNAIRSPHDVNHNCSVPVGGQRYEFKAINLTTGLEVNANLTLMLEFSDKEL